MKPLRSKGLAKLLCQVSIFGITNPSKCSGLAFSPSSVSVVKLEAEQTELLSLYQILKKPKDYDKLAFQQQVRGSPILHLSYLAEPHQIRHKTPDYFYRKAISLPTSTSHSSTKHPRHYHDQAPHHLRRHRPAGWLSCRLCHQRPRIVQGVQSPRHYSRHHQTRCPCSAAKGCGSRQG